MTSQRITQFAWCTAYYLLLNWTYLAVESVLFDDIGLRYSPPPHFYQFLGFAMALAPVFWLPTALERPSAVCQWMIYITLVAPLMFLPYHVLDRPPQEVLILPITILGLFALLAWTQRMPLIRLPEFYLHRQTVYAILLITGVAFTAIVLMTMSSFDLSLDDVYERRFAARDLVKPRTLLAYSIAILSSSLGPILVSLGFVRKRWDLLLCGLFGLLSLFSLAGTKTNLLTPIFLLGLFVMIAGNRRVFGRRMIIAACCLVLVSIVEFTHLNSRVVSTFFVRRELFIPSLLTSYYWDFFSDNPHVYYSDSFLQSLVPQQYDVATASLIGQFRFRSLETNANANFWASAFANLGYTGMVIITIVLGMLLRLIDSIARNGEFLVASLLVGICSITWSNGALETSMLSNGVAVSIVILYFLRLPQEAREASRLGSNPTIHVKKHGRRNLVHAMSRHRAQSAQPINETVGVGSRVRR